MVYPEKVNVLLNDNQPKGLPIGKAFFIAAICGRKIVPPWVVARVVLSLLMHPTPETIGFACSESALGMQEF
jgi:hypothetical protein